MQYPSGYVTTNYKIAGIWKLVHLAARSPSYEFRSFQYASIHIECKLECLIVYLRACAAQTFYFRQ